MVLLVELTCPAEEGIQAARLRKEGRYTQLVNSINSNESNWSAKLMTIEVGARGYVGRSMLQFLRKIGVPSKKAMKACKDISEIAAKCAYAIYLARDSLRWRRKPLLSLPLPKE